MRHLKRHITLAIFISMSGFLFAQNEVVVSSKNKSESPFYGFSAHLDIASPLMGLATDRGIIEEEGSFDVNFLDRFFPIIELGYASVNTQANNGSMYSATAPFGRLGVNFNLLKTKDKEGNLKPSRNYAYVGVRYGMSFVNYDVSNIPLTSGYWNENQLLNLNGKGYGGWGEVVAGVRVDMAKGFTMGWSVRVKLFLHSSLENKQEMWYVPGFGKSSGNAFTLNYTLGYTYRTKTERLKLKK